MRVFTLFFIISLTTIQISFAQISIVDSIFDDDEITIDDSFMPEGDTKIYNPGIYRNDSLIFFENTLQRIDALTQDTSIFKSICFIAQARDCNKMIKDYELLKNNEFYTNNCKDIKQKPKVKKNPYEGIIFLELFKHEGEFLISPEVWSAIWFNDNYLFQSCSNCEGQCISIQSYSKEDATVERMSGYSIYSKEDNYLEDISFKLIDPLKKIYITKIFYFGEYGRPIIAYYTPLSEICNFRQLHNRSWEEKTNSENKPIKYDIGFEEPKW